MSERPTTIRPENWKRLGDTCHIEMGQSPPSTYVFEGLADGLPFLQGNAEFGEPYPSPAYSCAAPAKVGQAGSVLISVRAPVGAVNLADRDYCIGRGLAAILPRRYPPTFIAAAVNNRSRELARVSQGTTFDAIGKRELHSLEVYSPELPIATKIAEVLDTLDAAIRGTEAVVAKLRAMKQGLLHDLLTRGIDANGDLRPPQPEAPHLYHQTPLGWLPKEWDAAILGACTSLITSGSRGWAQFYTDTGQLFVRSQNVRMGMLDLTDRQHVQVSISAEGLRTGLEAFDFLVTITGNGVGNACMVPTDWEETAFVSQHVGLVRFFDKSLGKYAGQYFISGAPGNRQILDSQYGQSKPGLSLANLYDLQMAVPPEDERSTIIEILAEADMRISKEVALLEKLRLQKSGLMDDLLTGRVSVTSLL